MAHTKSRYQKSENCPLKSTKQLGKNSMCLKLLNLAVRTVSLFCSSDSLGFRVGPGTIGTKGEDNYGGTRQPSGYILVFLSQPRIIRVGKNVNSWRIASLLKYTVTRSRGSRRRCR